MGLNGKQAAALLGVGESVYRDLTSGVRRTTGAVIDVIDRRTALACAALAAGLDEWRPPD
jgi:hypothetical protein